MRHMIMDNRDRQRLWDLMEPIRRAMEQPLRTLSNPGLMHGISATHRDPEARYPKMLADSRAALDALEIIYADAQRVHDAFVPAYPLVPLVGTADNSSPRNETTV